MTAVTKNLQRTELHERLKAACTAHALQIEPCMQLLHGKRRMSTQLEMLAPCRLRTPNRVDYDRTEALTMKCGRMQTVIVSLLVDRTANVNFCGVHGAADGLSRDAA